MAIVPSALAGVAQLTNSAAAIYTCPAASIAFIQNAVFLNTDTGSHTITVYVVRSGGSATTSNELISAQSISAGTTYKSTELSGVVLGAGDAIFALADTAAKVNYLLNGFLTGSSGS